MPKKEYTNGEIGILISEIHSNMKRLNKYIEGNGKKGLLDRMNDVEKCAEINSTFVLETTKLQKKTYERVIDIAWKIGTTILFVILGIDKFN